MTWERVRSATLVPHDGTFRPPGTPGPGASLRYRYPYPTGSGAVRKRSGTRGTGDAPSDLDRRAPDAGTLHAWRQPPRAGAAHPLWRLLLRPGTRLAGVLGRGRRAGRADPRDTPLAGLAAAPVPGLRVESPLHS